MTPPHQQQTFPGVTHDADSPASQIVKPLIPKDAFERIERAVKQVNKPLRDQIRAETGLKLSDESERLAIPIRVREGFTGPFGDIIMRYPDPQLWWLICGLRQFGAIVEGTNWLLSRWPQLENWQHLPPAAKGAGDAIARTRDAAAELQKLVANPPIIEEIKKISTDYLGCYFYPPGRPPWIEIYWMPIALIAAMIAVRMEDLAAVTLAHELGHGYTHLGRDIDGASWDTIGFAKSAAEVKEGLAQFYTDLATDNIASRQPGAHDAYEKFLGMQAGPYLAHEDWLKDQPHQRSETVRFTLLAARTKGIVKHDEWLASLAETNQKLRKPQPPGSQTGLFDSGTP
jgi:hypothetical protein